MPKAWPLVFLAAGVVSLHAQETTAPQRDWIRTHAVRVETVEAGHSFDDLQPIRKLVGDARIVALGEPTHGSREVFRMKHRLVEFLVEEMGFSVFSIEANLPEAFRLNDYVMHGRGDPAELIRGMYFWTWQTEEVREMVEWMRRRNAEAERRGRAPLRFTGFDVQFPEVAAGIVTGFAEASDPAFAPTVREAVKATKGTNSGGAQFGVATASFPVELARGRRLTYRGWIRTEDLQDGFAGLWWRCDAGARIAQAFDNMQGRGPRGTSDWQRFEIAMSVPADTTNINFGVLMPGRGKAWFDGLQIELDGVAAAVPAFDLDFEGPELKGFWTPHAYYTATVDKAVAKTGRQSLRIEGAPPASEGDPAAAARAWQAIVDRLESSRERASSDEDRAAADWAIVNARLVKDAMDLRSGGSPTMRDEAMARMLAWILHQSPRARVVVWAHNNHVQRQPGSMGAFLERAFPGQMVVMGFATGTGTYRALSSDGKTLGVHALEPPPPGSIERALQEAGVPRAVLDLRRAKAGSADSGWLLEEHPMRSIGAQAMGAQFRPYRIRDSFDALVWIAETSAAVPMRR